MTARLFTPDRREMLAITGGAMLLPVALEGTAQAATTAATAAATSGRGQPFDSDWRFQRGAGDGLEAISLDDSGWRKVEFSADLPSTITPEYNSTCSPVR